MLSRELSLATLAVPGALVDLAIFSSTLPRIPAALIDLVALCESSG